MLQFFSKFKKRKSTSMAEEPSTPGPSEFPANDTIQLAAATGTSPEQTAVFMEAYDCAKNNYQWNKVVSAVSDHPEWLTRIPQGRRWTMLHQIVYCGNVPHLNEVLAFEISNEEFRLLCKSLDDKTVREVASERAHIYPQMLRRIERLVAIDQVLNNARDGKWELVKQFLRQQGDIVNEKPPYRKYYLVHFLALTGQLDMFRELSTICEFRLDLLAGNKTINRVAREHNFIEFAEHIEALCPNINEITDDTHSTTLPMVDSGSPNATPQPFFSQSFHDDPGITIFSLNSNSFATMLLSSDDSILHMNNPPSWPDQQSQAASTANQHQQSTASSTTTSNANSTDEGAAQADSKKLKGNKLPPMTDEEQMQYEKTVVDNMKKFSADNLLSSAVTCCITKTILRDPALRENILYTWHRAGCICVVSVVAADGFTYEREAIVSWFKQSTRSPMTNQELENQELKPNHAIKSILRSLAESSMKQEQPNGKPGSSGNDTV